MQSGYTGCVEYFKHNQLNPEIDISEIENQTDVYCTCPIIYRHHENMRFGIIRLYRKN